MPKQRAEPGSKESKHNRGLEELRNKIQRTIYAVTEYHLITRLDRLADKEIKKILMPAFIDALLAARDSAKKYKKK